MAPSKPFWLTRWLTVVGLCLVCSTLTLAQSTGGRILGRVADPSGAVLAGVKVTATNEATGVSLNTQTTASGDYSFPTVPVGTYTLSFDLSGFKNSIQKGVGLDLNQVITLNMTLQIGGSKEVIEVTSEAPLVDTTSTQLGAVMDSRQVSQLPLNARDTYQLLQLQPGVQGVGGTDLFYGSNTAGAVSVNGGRGRSNNFNVNGGDGNDLFVNSPAIQPTPDSIAEFRVLSNTFDAEYGRNSGAVINVVTKSGTNGFHGSVYEFLRNQMFNSKGPLDLRRADDKQNQFGGTFGGPIKKDQTFFFASYEGRRVVHGISSDAVTVPTVEERGGNFLAPDGSGTTLSGAISSDLVAQMLIARASLPGSKCNVNIPTLPSQNGGSVSYDSAFPNGQISPDCFDPAAAALLQLYVPGANTLDSNGVLNAFRSIPNEDSHANQFTLKVDHRINASQNLTGYYYFNDSFDSQPFTRFQALTSNLLQGFGNNNAFRSQQLNLTHTWTISTSVVNELRATYFREAQGTFLHPQHTSPVQSTCGPASAPAAAFCFTGATDVPGVIPTDPLIGITPGLGPNHEGVPFVTISGGFTIGNDYEGELPQIGNTYQVSDNLTKVIGNHTTKFGVDYRNQRFLQTLYFDPNGNFSYFGGGPNDSGNIFANYLLGLPDSYLQGSAQTEDVRGNSIYLFAQDSWKIKPNLTLNYGLRWEFNQPLYDAGLRYQTFRPGTPDTVFKYSGDPALFPLGLVIPGDKGVPKGLTDSYYRAFAPRVGIAWDPLKDGKTTIRAGWGLFYNPIEQLVLEQFQAEPPFGGSSLISEGLFNTPFVSQGGSKGNLTTAPNPFGGIINPARGSTVDWASFRPILLFGELEPHLRAQYTAQYNFGITRELTKDLVLSLGYVGSQGHRLLATRDLNYGNPQTCIDLANLSALDPTTVTDGFGNQVTCGPFFADAPFAVPANAIPSGFTLHLPDGTTVTGPNNSPIGLVGLRRYSSPQCKPVGGWDPDLGFINGCPSDGVPVFSSIFAQNTEAASNYNSLQASLEKRLSHGIQFELAYTFSKSIDNASSFENILKPICGRCNRALSLFDSRQRFVFSYLWALPVPNYNGFKGKVLDGWTISGITTFQAGFPIRVGSNNDSELMNSFDFELPGKPDLIAPFHTQDPRKHGGYGFDPTSFALPQQTADSTPLQLLGNAPRTICCGPGINNFDFSIQKITPLGEGKHIEFRAEFFNAFNHTQFLNADGNISDANLNDDGTVNAQAPGDFGRVKRARDPRNIQFALKFAF